VERAPAKVNLGLRVVGRRDDGYHLLESIFLPLDLADEVRITLEPETPPDVRLVSSRAPGAIGVDLDSLAMGDDNLAARAARAFLAASGHRLGIELELRKRIPVAAGLGGGSSDAGAVLRGLSALLPGALEAEELASLALSLGADVPFFLEPRPAFVTGIGEEIRPVEGLPPLCLLLAGPGEPLPTAAVFSAWDAQPVALTAAEPGSTMRALSALVDTEPRDSASWADRLSALLRNDLLSAARHLCPSLGPLWAAMEEMGAAAVGMSGSGATIFGVFPELREAEAAMQRIALGDSGWARLARTRTGR
jgi:4-diphosphocytidyl-2-C-methyl-D-erythritol kinase